MRDRQAAPSGPVLFLVPSLIRAGAETQVVSLANGLARRGAAVHLATFGSNLDLLDQLDRSRVQFHALERGGRLGLNLITSLARLMREQRFSVVHCTLQVSLFYAWAARLLSGLRDLRPALVLAVHTTLNRTRREELFDRLLYRPLLAACVRVVFVCRAQAEYWYARFPELKGKGEVVYNGIDVARFDPGEFGPDEVSDVRRRYGVPDGAPVILCVARLRPEKGHHLLLEAFSALGSQSTAHLLLAGDGAQREAIVALSRELHLEGRVHLLGDVAHTRPLYALATATVLASTSVETFSMAMLESLAMQTPMIASDVGGLREAITPGETGWLVPPGDVAALTVALGEAAGDPVRAAGMGETARRRVLEAFTVDAMVRDTAALLRQSSEGRVTLEAGGSQQ